MKRHRIVAAQPNLASWRKRSHVASLYMREVALKASGSRPPIDNLYFATVQRSGSQWLRQLFSDARLRQHTGLAGFPQHRYEWGEFFKRFPAYTFVPGLYMSYGLYDEIRKPPRYRTLYVIRDPRSIVVSWYWAARDTHSMMGKIPKHRAILKHLNQEAGISYAIREHTTRFADMRTWAYNSDDRHVTIMRFEELTANTFAAIDALLQECDVVVPPDELAEILSHYTKEKMRNRDLRSRSAGAESHYRKRTSDYRSVFTSEHTRLFRSIAGDLPELLGYPTG